MVESTGPMPSTPVRAVDMWPRASREPQGCVQRVDPSAQPRQGVVWNLQFRTERNGFDPPRSSSRNHEKGPDVVAQVQPMKVMELPSPLAYGVESSGWEAAIW